MAISRLIKSDGKIVLLSTDLNQCTEKQLRPLRAEFQMVFQDPFSSLNPRLNVEQTIGEGLGLHSLSGLEISQRIDEALERSNCRILLECVIHMNYRVVNVSV